MNTHRVPKRLRQHLRATLPEPVPWTGAYSDHPACAPFTHFRIIDIHGVAGPVIRARTDTAGVPLEWIGQQMPSKSF